MDLRQNPFYILGASPADSRERLTELAEAKILSDETSLEALSHLTHPRRRLTAEMAWLPGLNTEDQNSLSTWLDGGPLPDWEQIKDLPPLARANVLAEVLARDPGLPDDSLISLGFTGLAEAFEEVRPGEVLALVNQERRQAGFPEVLEPEQVIEEIQSRRRYFRQKLSAALFARSGDLVSLLTTVASLATQGGTRPAPTLTDEVISAYEVEAQDFLERQKLAVDDIIGRIEASVKAREVVWATDGLVEELSRATSDWLEAARPAIHSFSGRGLTHQASEDMASRLLDLQAEVNNEYHQHHPARHINEIVLYAFNHTEAADTAPQNKRDVYDKVAGASMRHITLAYLVASKKRCLRQARKNPARAEYAARAFLREATKFMTEIESQTEWIKNQARDEVAEGLLECAIRLANSGRPDQAELLVKMLETAREWAVSSEITQEIAENLNRISRGEPYLWRANSDNKPVIISRRYSDMLGFGAYYMNFPEIRPDRGYLIITKCLCFCCIPWMPLARLIVTPQADGFKVLSSEPLLWPMKFFYYLPFILFFYWLFS